MTRKGKKLEPKLHLDMDFGEALERFVQADPKEVAESIERSKQRKPPGDKAPGGLEKSKSDPPKRRRHKRPDGASAD